MADADLVRKVLVRLNALQVSGKSLGAVGLAMLKACERFLTESE